MFEWDGRKAAANLQEHGVSFDEAATVVADADALDGPDIRHSVVERRFLRIGRSIEARVLTVAYTTRRQENGKGAEIVRIISARRASRKERAAYRAAP